jgi:hypothetical protein
MILKSNLYSVADLRQDAVSRTGWSKGKIHVEREDRFLKHNTDMQGHT